MRSLIVHQTLFNALGALDDASIGALIRAAMKLTSDEAYYEPPKDPALAFAWEVLKEQVLQHGKKYEETCQRKSDAATAAANARWHPSASQMCKRMPTHTDAPFKHRASAK